MVRIAFFMYLASVLLAAVLYIPKFAQYFAVRKKPERLIATKKRRIALVIPARNESKTIVDLINSVKKQDYDTNYFDVNIIVKESDDPTVEIAKAMGANVFVVPEQTCKGEALDGYFKSLDKNKLESYEAFAIIDADAVLSENYVSELNNALEHDRQIFVSRKLIKNFLGGKNARSAECNRAALTYPIVDDLCNNYRTVKNIPLNICGQGLMVRREVIVTLGGWPYRTLTEDFELKLDGYLKGFTSMYYPYAVIYTEEAITHRQNVKRRVRWLTGCTQCEKIYKKAVEAKIDREDAPFALKFDILYYRLGIYAFMAGLVGSSSFGSVLSVVYFFHGDARWAFALFALVVFPALFTYLILFVFSCIAMACYRDAFAGLPLKEKIYTLMTEPFYLLEYVIIYFKSRRATDKDVEWDETERVVFEGITL